MEFDLRKNMKMLACACLSGLLVLCTAAYATGQSSRVARGMTPQLALAVLTVSEAGWEEYPDMLGIHAVILRTQERIQSSYVTAAGSYARRLIGRQGEITRPWLWDLNAQGTAPARWPVDAWVRTSRGAERQPHAPWSAFRERWLRTHERAGEVVALRLDDWAQWGMCERVPDDWGGSMDIERAMRLGLVPVNCGETKNHFFVRPSTLAREQEAAAEPEQEELGG
jgi:hypothetical protein